MKYDNTKTENTAYAYVLGNLETFAKYNAQGFHVYVFARPDGSIDFTPFTSSTVWNHECPDTLLYIFPAFEGGHPEMVNDSWNLLTEDEQRAASKADMGVAEYLESIGSSYAARQIELWCDEVIYYLDDYAVNDEE